MSFAYNDSLIGEWEASDAPLLLNHSDFRIEARGNASDMEAFRSPPHVYFVSPPTPLCWQNKKHDLDDSSNARNRRLAWRGAGSVLQEAPSQNRQTRIRE